MRYLIHIIPDLNNGGAENVLVELSKGLSKEYKQIIISLRGNEKDFLYSKAEESSQVLLLKNDKAKIFSILYTQDKAVIICWLYAPIYWIYKVQFLKGKLNHKIIWNIRNSSFTLLQVRQKIILFLFGFFSQVIKPTIIYCGFFARKTHQKYFFYSKRSVVIQNRLVKEVPISVLDGAFPNEYYLYVGRYHYQKGPDILMNVFGHITNEYPNVKLLIAGGGWKLKYIPRHLTANVNILGNIKNIFPLYKKAKALLHTSRIEGYPNVVAEATVMGCPVYALKTGDTQEILNNNDFGYTFENKNDLVRKVLVDHKKVFNTQSRKESALNAIKKLDFKITYNEYLKLINENFI